MTTLWVRPSIGECPQHRAEPRQTRRLSASRARMKYAYVGVAGAEDRNLVVCSPADLSPGEAPGPQGRSALRFSLGGGHTSPFDRTKRALHFRTSRETRHICPTTYGPHRGPRAQVTRSDAQLLLHATAAMMSWADSRSSRAGGYPQRHCVRFCSTLVLRPRDRPQREARYVSWMARKTLLSFENLRLQSVVKIC